MESGDFTSVRLVGGVDGFAVNSAPAAGGCEDGGGGEAPRL